MKKRAHSRRNKSHDYRSHNNDDEEYENFYNDGSQGKRNKSNDYRPYNNGNDFSNQQRNSNPDKKYQSVTNSSYFGEEPITDNNQMSYVDDGVNKLKNGFDQLSMHASNVATDLSTKIKQIDLTEVKSTIQQTGERGLNLVVNLFNTAKEKVSSLGQQGQYNQFNNNNTSISNEGGVHSGGGGYNSGSGGYNTSSNGDYNSPPRNGRNTSSYNNDNANNDNNRYLDDGYNNNRNNQQSKRSSQYSNEYN
jgi:hypothetical protein